MDGGLAKPPLSHSWYAAQRQHNRGTDGPNTSRHRHRPQGRTRAPYFPEAGTRNRALRDQQKAGPHHPLLHRRTTAIVSTFPIQSAKGRQTPAWLCPANCPKNNNRAPSRSLERRDYKFARHRRHRRAVNIEQSQRPRGSKKGRPPTTQRGQVSLRGRGGPDRSGSAELMSPNPRYLRALLPLSPAIALPHPEPRKAILLLLCD